MVIYTVSLLIQPLLVDAVTTPYIYIYIIMKLVVVVPLVNITFIIFRSLFLKGNH